MQPRRGQHLESIWRASGAGGSRASQGKKNPTHQEIRGTSGGRAGQEAKPASSPGIYSPAWATSLAAPVGRRPRPSRHWLAKEERKPWEQPWPPRHRPVPALPGGWFGLERAKSVPGGWMGITRGWGGTGQPRGTRWAARGRRWRRRAGCSWQDPWGCLEPHNPQRPSSPVLVLCWALGEGFFFCGVLFFFFCF